MGTQYSSEELADLGLAAVGSDVLIHKTVQIFGAQWITIGSHVRIDAFAVLTAGAEGGVDIGDHVHLAVGVVIFGGGGRVTLEDYCGLSARVCVFSASDDYSGGFLTNPTVPDGYRNVICGSVTLRRHALVGAGSIIMPRIEIGQGAAVGALSYVNKSVPPLMVVGGNPLRRVGARSPQIFESEQRLRDEEDQ